MVALRVALNNHSVNEHHVVDFTDRCLVSAADVGRAAEGPADLAVQFSMFADGFIKQLGDGGGGPAVVRR